jgi:hypothetical protein
MAEQKKHADAVIIGYGWTGAIRAKRSPTPAYLSSRSSAGQRAPDFEYPTHR